MRTPISRSDVTPLRSLVACVALLLTGACAPDAGIVAPRQPGHGAVLEAGDPTLAACEDARRTAFAVWEITGVDPLCATSEEAMPLLWRAHLAQQFPAGCGCPGPVDTEAAR